MRDGFNSQVAAQVAAFFTQKEGGEIAVLKLIKLVYLADRESMSQTGFPITNDNFVSMPHGPVNSQTLNLVDGSAESIAWSDLLSDRADYKLGLTRSLEEDDLDDLSDADIEALEKVWAEFGHMDRWQIRDWTHDNCPEWEDPNGSANPLPHERVLKYLGVDAANDLADEIEADREAEKVFAGLRR